MDLIEPFNEIEDLVVRSVQLGEKAHFMRLRIGKNLITPEQRKEIEELEEESERLWQKAKKLGKRNVRRENYEDLANAILTKAITDYEELLSGSISDGTHGVSKPVIEEFLRQQTLVRLDVESFIKRIERIYYDEFIPYCKKHNVEIANQWAEFDRQNLSTDDRIKYTKHRCPLCRGSLKPMNKGNIYNIACTSCHLSVFMPPFEKIKQDTTA